MRRALIIGSPDKEIPGVYDDMKNYRDFLKSFAGGAWYENEIITLESPTKAQVDAQLRLLETADYSFLVFAGHGGYSHAERATMLQINPHTTISENDLKRGAQRRTVIFDTCRVHIDQPQAFREAILKSIIAMDSYQDPAVARILFDRSLSTCYPGIAVMYGCSVGESSGDIPGSGGRYSSTLLEVASDWKGQRNTFLSVSDAHNKAAELVRLRSGNAQNPQGEFPRSTPRFPLTINA